VDVVKMNPSVCDASFAKATERMNDNWQHFRVAEENAFKATAEVARLSFLRFVDANPEVTEMVIDVEFNYDDEGGYYRSVSCYTGVQEIDDGYDFYEEMSSFRPEALCILCGLAPDWTGDGKITVQEARERRF